MAKQVPRKICGGGGGYGHSDHIEGHDYGSDDHSAYQEHESHPDLSTETYSNGVHGSLHLESGDDHISHHEEGHLVDDHHGHGAIPLSLDGSDHHELGHHDDIGIGNTDETFELPSSSHDNSLDDEYVSYNEYGGGFEERSHQNNKPSKDATSGEAATSSPTYVSTDIPDHFKSNPFYSRPNNRKHDFFSGQMYGSNTGSESTTLPNFVVQIKPFQMPQF